MKKGIAVSASLALCASLGNIVNVSATSIIDERFPDFTVLPTIIYPHDNGVHFVSNSHALAGHVRSFATFVSDAGYDLSDLRANYPLLPIDNLSPIVHAELKESDNLVINTVTPQSITTVMSSASSNTLYYVFDFWDNTVEVQRVSYQNCIDEAGGKFSGLECRMSKRSDEVIYKAYVDGVELVPEVTETPSSTLPDINDPILDNNSTNPDSSAYVDPGSDPVSNESTLITENAYPGSTQNVSKTVPWIAKSTSSATNVNSSLQNVKNTNTDSENIVLSTPANMPLDPTPPSSPAATTGAITHDISEEEQAAWWALLPLFLLVFISFGGFLLGIAKKRRQAEQSQPAY